MPKFIQATDRMLTDPELLKQHQMSIDIQDQDIQQEAGADKDKHSTTMSDKYEETKGSMITMDIGVGVYDILNDNFDEKKFKGSAVVGKSAEPIVRVQGIDAEIDDSSSSGADSDLYFEFNSDSADKGEAASSTSNSTNPIMKAKQQQRPLIVDITPQEQSSEGNKTLKAVQANRDKKSKKNRNKRKKRDF